MSIIDSIRLSGTTYQIQVTVDAALDSGSTNPVANSAITTALDDKVNVADNNASAYTFENKISGVEYGYSEHFAGPIYIRYTGSTSSSGNYYAGNILCYTSEWGWDYISLYFDLSDGQITATTVSSNYFDVEIENGEAALTFKDGYYLRQYESRNEFVALIKTTYESGQSADVIEDTVYDVFDKLNDKIDKTSDNDVTSSSMYFSDGYLNSRLYIKKQTSLSSTVKIDSSTIKSSDNGLSVQFVTSEAADKILNLGSGSYGTLFSTDTYDTSFNEFTITFNPNCTQHGVYYFSVRIIDASNSMYDVTFEYDSADMSAVYTSLDTYCIVTDTLSTDYKLKVTAKEGYKIARLYNSEYMVGGVDNTTPNNYISNLVTTPSYVHNGQDVIDDIYDKLDDKQDTLVSSQNIKTINNESILGSGNIDIQGGGKAIEAGRGISITTGETADTVSFDLPISAGTGTNSIAEGNSTTASGNYSHAEGYGTQANNLASHAEGYQAKASGYVSHAEGWASSATSEASHAEGYETVASGDYSHAEGRSTIASGDYSHAEGRSTTASGQSSHAEGYYTTASGQSSHAEGIVTQANGQSSHAEGFETIANNNYEHASGHFNVSSSASTTFGDSGNTLFSVGNGTDDDARHNAFEIRQNGDIYISSGNTDIKLQDHLGGSSITVDTALDSGSTNPVENKAIYNKFDEVEEATAAALNELNDAVSGKVDTSTYNTYTAATDTALNGKQPTLVSGTNIKTINNESILGSGNIDIQGGSVTVDSALSPTSENPVQNKVIYSKIDEVEEVTAAGLNALNDKITPTVELTQAQYDALTTKDPNTYYIITDAQAGDLTNYYTKSETNTLLGGKADTATTYTKTEVDTALNGKQATLVSGTNIKTINNESILGSGNIDIQGGGKAVSGGTNISITTGETADTINCTLPFSYEGDNLKTTVSGNSFVSYFHYGQIFGINNTLQGKNSGTGTIEKNTTIIGYNNQSLKMDDSIVIGSSNNLGNIFGVNYNNYVFGFSNTVNPVGTQDNIANNNFVIGNNNTINQKSNNFIFGYGIKPSNNDEFSLGKYNNSVSGSSTFGDSGNTLFSVGNGTADNARHNAFEIRQNGDIYLTKDGQDVKLQDQLGGSSINVVQTTGTSTTDVMSQNAVTTQLSGYVTTDTDQTISGKKVFTYSSSSAKAIEFKQTHDSAKVGFSIKNTADTNNEVASFEFRPNTFTIDGVQHPLIYFGHYRNKNTANAGVPQTVIGFRQYDQLNAAAYHYLLPLPEKAKTPFNLTTSFKDYYAPMGFKNGSTMITADNTGVVDLSSELGGLKLVKLTQTEYDALATKDSSTLYIIVN